LGPACRSGSSGRDLGVDEKKRTFSTVPWNVIIQTSEKERNKIEVKT